MQANLVVYDIPTHGEAQNPSAHFRRRGFRVNYSCWIVPSDRIPWNLLHELQQQGASWHVVAFAQEESERIMALLVDTLRKEVDNAVSAAVAAENNAQTPGANETQQQQREKYRRRAYAAVARARRLLADAAECAKGFGSTGIASDLLRCRARVDMLHRVAIHRADSYAAMTRALAAVQTPLAQQLADDAREDALPAGIGADYLIDEGSTPNAVDIADAVQHAFGQ